jgi:hypothetical protein
MPGRQPAAQLNEVGYVTHDYASGTTDWTLNKSEAKCEFLVVSAAGGAVNIVAPLKVGKKFTVRNGSGYSCTVLVSGGSGIAIANAKTATVICGTSDYLRLTADATH